jgi:hypothetical protein
MIQEVVCFLSNGKLVLVTYFYGFALQICFVGRFNIALSGFKISTQTKLKLLRFVRNLHFLYLHILIKISAVVWLKKTGIVICIVFHW